MRLKFEHFVMDFHHIMVVFFGFALVMFWAFFAVAVHAKGLGC